MTLGKAILEAALIGFQTEKDSIDLKMAEVRKLLGQTSDGDQPLPLNGKPRKRRSAAIRKRMAAAQKKRWADFYKTQK